MKTPARILIIGLFMALIGPTHAALGNETPEDRIRAAGHTLPPFNPPVATYVKYVQVGNLLFLSGHGDCIERGAGKIDKDLTVEQGYAAAQNTALCMLASMKQALGDLSRVKRFVRVLGMVNATEDFTRHPEVVNGFADLMVVVFGENGKAARAAVGMQSLPRNQPVEVEAIVELWPED